MSKQPNITRIAEAVRSHHGGFEQASEVQIKRLWDSLDAATQQKYLTESGEPKVKAAPAENSSVKKETKPDAPSPESK